MKLFGGCNGQIMVARFTGIRGNLGLVYVSGRPGAGSSSSKCDSDANRTKRVARAAKPSGR